MQVELNQEFEKAADVFRVGESVIMITPPIGENYWLFQVKLSEDQAIVGFPKFGTIGIGFLKETDWNTNLPYRTCSAEEIFNHIKHNKGDDKISDADCLEAIRLVKDASELLMEHSS